MKKVLGNLIAFAALVMLLISGTLVVLRMNERPRTDDAVLFADIANIAPEVSGRVISLNIHNNQSVHVGDILFIVDPEPYQLRLNAAKAQYHLATTSLTRMEPLLRKGYVTAEQIDEARAAKESARAAEALAKRDLVNTVVKAPFDGKIVGLNIAVGEYATTGHPLFTMIKTSKWYVIANFRETEVRKMKKGALSTVYVMAHPDQPLQGHVDSVGWGVTSEDSSFGNGLPSIPKSLNWVRLAQRFPVRILLDNPPDNLMRVGASAVAVVHYEVHNSHSAVGDSINADQ
ncbi:efflux RND transporter periplasmic adaptor subunit [Legionella fallonii]|uniref:Multidrug resistance efflux pum, Secretion protein HlyD n=1 Tax=Legionella fallonii LLAP-10 TaxID=1212491 RepID=A0A098G0U4_9GAMM|nr:efflux RND transporter periplasmic adaptor subunit [Legionella fallonii]CEG56083.1 Multidrug resistance efflux pum, Secretion protein HlyD [Legionella fallonii LLAP-10]